MPHIMWQDNAGEEMVFDSHHITMTSFKLLYQKLLIDTKRMLFSDVLLNLELPDMHHDMFMMS